MSMNETSPDEVDKVIIDREVPATPAKLASPSERKPQRDAMSAATLKRERSRDAMQAMKENEAARQATRAKTARVRAERLAREAEAASAPKPLTRKKK